MKIKKNLKYIIPSAVLIAGMVLVITGLASGAINKYKSNLNITDFEANVSDENIINLDINVPIADLNIISSNDVDEFKISAENISKKNLEYSTGNNTFRLRYETKKWYQSVFIPGYIHKQGKIDVYVPADIKLKDVQINSKYCNTEISYITAERIFIDCGSGNSQIKNLSCDYTEINNTSGDINCLNINAKGADITIQSGKADFKNFVSEAVNINNKFSKLSLSGVISGNSRIKSGMGDISMTLYGNESDYLFDVIDGDVTVNNKKNPQNNDGKYKFTVSSGNGNVDIDIE